MRLCHSFAAVVLLVASAAGQELVRDGGFEQPLESCWTRTQWGFGVYTCDRSRDFQPDSDWEARDSAYDGPGWCRLSQWIPVTGHTLRFSCDASLRTYGPSYLSAAAVSIIYYDSIFDTLGQTRIVWPPDYWYWPRTPTLSIINAPDTGWHHYDINLATELGTNLPGVNRSLVRRITVGLYTFMWGGVDFPRARVLADNISLTYDSTRHFIYCGLAPQRLEPGDSTDVWATVENVSCDTIAGATAVLRSAHPLLRVVDSVGTYRSLRPGERSANDSDRFAIVIDSGIPFGTLAPCTLFVASADDVDTLLLSVACGDTATLRPEQDDYGRYWAFEDVDSSYGIHPEFNWVEIADVGTPVSLGDDQTITIPLPTEFPWSYYDQVRPQLSICSNGWIAHGPTYITSYTNTNLPTNTLPNAVAVFWDDLFPDSLTRIRYWYDSLGPRFIVEYDSIVTYVGRTERYKFEFIIEPPAPGNSNNMLLVNYQMLGDVSSSTVGIQLVEGGYIGLQCLYNGSYHRNAARLRPGRAIRYLDVWDAIAERRGERAVRAGFSVWPNPFRQGATIRLSEPAVRGGAVTVTDAAGRAVRALTVRRGAESVNWDGCDDAGRRLAPGIYFVSERSAVGGHQPAVSVTKVVLTR
jgi:hypothetical protein